MNRKLGARASILRMAGVACAVIVLLASSAAIRAQAPEAPKEPGLPTLTVDGAIRWALEHNPELMALRQQHGIAAAGIVIANTYPFNPVLESKVREANGPGSAGVTNMVSNEHKVFMDVEMRGQRFFRRDAANATLSRTDWEIAGQELALSIRVVRAFETVVYRHKKKQLIEQTLDLNTKAAEHGEELWKKNLLKTPDLIALRTEAADYRTQLTAARYQLVLAWNDLRRVLGVVTDTFALDGDLIYPPVPQPFADLEKTALEQRPELHVRQAAVNEAEARLRLEIANRYGNPNFGPAYEYDPTRINLIGAQLVLPLPVFNTHKGDIQQREAERNRASYDLIQTEVLIRQDVFAALKRLEQARAGADLYRNDVRPVMDAAMRDMRNLFEHGDPNVDALRVLDVQRKQLRARDGELDALWELRQAQADLSAAVGDPALSAFSLPPLDKPAH
ncbi:MAG TPA: TolC family protein [Gemmataceae bacterium]|nr:TolC family protein [Gemmataceae bacterium]